MLRMYLGRGADLRTMLLTVPLYYPDEYIDQMVLQLETTCRKKCPCPSKCENQKPLQDIDDQKRDKGSQKR